MSAVEVVAGALLVVAIVTDAVSTLVVTQKRSAFWRPTRIWYSVTWRATRAIAARLPPRAGESALATYPAASLLGLLLVWLVGLMVGWALVYHGIGDHVARSSEFGTALYYAGATLLSPTFGTATTPAERTLTLLNTLTGLGTIALMISYLPALYGAYSRREARLLTLDDPLGTRITPVRIIALHVDGADVERLNRFFAEWELWCAEILESHVSYPMLALFRSQHPGQSWVSALGVVTDAAALTSASVAGADQREPYFMYRRGRRAIVEITNRLHCGAPREPSWLTEENFDVAWSTMTELGIALRDKSDAWATLQALREPYGSQLEQLITYLVAPHGFWGHSAEATVAAEVEAAVEEARLRARRS